MQNEMRDRLIELIDIEYDGEPNCLLCEEASDKCQKCEHRWEYKLADHLIENGVIVPPCKAGDKVWVIDDCVTHEECCKCEHYLIGGFGDPSECNRTRYGEKHIDCIKIVEQTATLHDVLSWITPSIFTEKIMWGKTVFLTKEEAEQKLKGGADNG